MVILFGGTKGKLDDLRYRKFVQRVTSSNAHISPERLPPTNAACNEHSARTYLQIMIWMGHDTMRPGEWGWIRREKMFQPVMTSLTPAPEYLLELIHCKCLQSCGTQRCTCKRYKLTCSSACGACQETYCENSQQEVLSEEDDEPVDEIGE